MHSKYIKTIIEIKIIAFKKCWPLNVIGDPDIIPCSFKKAITEPENVMAPTAAPMDISIKLPSLIFPGVPKLNASGFKKQILQQIPQLVPLDYENLQLIRAWQSLVFYKL